MTSGSVAAPVKLEVRNVSKYFRGPGGWFQVLRRVSLAARQQEFVSIVGPSGCGKSTLFNILAGLEEATEGVVCVDGADVTGASGLVAYMPQKDLLLPWKSVLDNTILGSRLAGIPRARAREEARGWFPRFGLHGFEEAYPSALSGGMRQRAALLRTVLARRDILLLDEPFGALDALTRVDMQSWLLDLRSALGKTIVLITHDVEEALYLSDRVWVMGPRPGGIVDSVDVALPDRLDHDRTVTSEAFVTLKQRVLHSLRGEMMAR